MPLVVTVLVSFVTRPKPDAELEGLVYGLTPLPSEAHLPMYQRPAFLAAVVAVALVALNIAVW